MESKKLSARVSAYRDAVVAARRAGVTWAQLAALFDAQPKYFAKVCTKAMSGGRYQPTEQLPLPEPAVAVGTVKSTGSGAQPVVQAATEAATPVRKPLPGIRKIGEGTDDERFARLRALGIDTSSMEKE